MTTIDGIRQAEKVTVPGHLIERIDFLSRMLGRSRSEVVVLAFDNFAPPVEHAAPGGRPGVGVQPCAPAPENGPEAPTVAATYTDPDGDRLTLLALHSRPADWSLVLTTADGEVERDVFFEDDETLAGWCRAGLGAIEDRWSCRSGLESVCSMLNNVAPPPTTEADTVPSTSDQPTPNRQQRRHQETDDVRFLTAAELAARWGVSKAHVYNMLHKGLPSVTIGGRARRFRTDQVDAWIEGSDEQPEG